MVLGHLHPGHCRLVLWHEETERAERVLVLSKMSHFESSGALLATTRKEMCALMCSQRLWMLAVSLEECTHRTWPAAL